MDMEKKPSTVESIRKFFAPVFSNEQDNPTQTLLNFLTLLYTIAVGLALLGFFVFLRHNSPGSLAVGLFRAALPLLILLIAQGMVRLRFVRGGVWFLTIAFWLNTLYQSWSSGGSSSVEYATFSAIVLLAGLFLGIRVSIITAVASLIAGFVLFILGNMGKLPPPPAANPTLAFITNDLRIVLVAGMLYLFLKRLDETLKKYRTANAELEDASRVLEQRVAERTRALTLSTEIGRSLSTLLDVDALTGEVVNQIQQALHYDYVQIYLFDDPHEYLVLDGGTGEVGQVLLAREHKIHAGKGLVGRAAKMNRPVLVGDVARDLDWLANPLLPDTKSELAVPVSAGDQVLGVLDVQQNRIDGLSQADVDFLQMVANQFVPALQNARAYTQAHRRAEREELAASLGQKIQHAATIDEVLQVAVIGLGQALDAQRSSVELRSRTASADGKN